MLTTNLMLKMLNGQICAMDDLIQISIIPCLVLELGFWGSVDKMVLYIDVYYMYYYYYYDWNEYNRNIGENSVRGVFRLVIFILVMYLSYKYCT